VTDTLRQVLARAASDAITGFADEITSWAAEQVTLAVVPQKASGEPEDGQCERHEWTRIELIDIPHPHRCRAAATDRVLVPVRYRLAARQH
jgi:hypothetical protein